MANPRVTDIEQLFVIRKRQAIRLNEIGCDGLRTPGNWVHSIDILMRQFRFAQVTLIVTIDPIGRICKPDRAIRVNDNIIRTIEALPFISIRDHGDRTVVLGARDAASTLLTRNESTMAVSGVAICIVSVPTKYASLL